MAAAAAATKKVTRKELLKTPDEFLTISEKAYFFMREHAKQVITGAVTIVGIIVVAVGVNWYLGYTKTKAIAAYNEAAAPLYSGAEIGLDKADATAGTLEKFIEAYGSSKPARYALLDLGNLYFRLEKYDKSAAVYQKYLSSITPEEESLRPYVQDSLAHAYEAEKDYAAAAKTWEDVLKLDDSTLKEQAYMGLIRVRLSAGDTKGAQQAYEELAKEFPGSISTQMAAANLEQAAK